MFEQWKAARADKEFAKGMDLAMRGRSDLAQRRFDRAQRLGLDVKAKITSLAKDELEQFRQKIVRKPRSTEPQDNFAMSQLNNNQAQTLYDARPRMHVTDDAGVQSAAKPAPRRAQQEQQTQAGPNPIEDDTLDTEFCDGVVRSVRIKRGFSGPPE
jgi:hypothetical protein